MQEVYYSITQWLSAFLYPIVTMLCLRLLRAWQEHDPRLVSTRAGS